MPKRLTPRGQAAPPVAPEYTGVQLTSKEAAETPAPRKRPRTTDDGARYVRNLHHISASVRLGTGRKIELKPRGQREDMDIVSKAEQLDPKFLGNRGLLFEVITVDAAVKIMAGQQVNAAKRGNSVWDHLRNEEGKAYEGTGPTIEEAFERQAITVGRLKETSGSAHLSEDTDIERVAGAPPKQASVPGSQGHPATELMNSVPGNISPEDYHEFLLWKQFQAQKHAAE